MDKIRTIIIDDEELARLRIRRLLQEEKNFEIVAECANGPEAVESINKLKPDLIFLDIQMPEMDGFEVIEHIGYDSIPMIIFVTAYDKYAIKAFDVHAVDYLLKPFDDERFYDSLNYVKEKSVAGPDQLSTNKIFDLLKSVTTDRGKYKERLLVKKDGRFYFINVMDISRIKAAGKYIDVYANGKSHLIRKTMNEIETQLDPELFIRVHRSAIINIDHIREIQYWYKNEYIFILKNDERITSGSSYRKNLAAVLDK